MAGDRRFDRTATGKENLLSALGHFMPISLLVGTFTDVIHYSLSVDRRISG